MSSGKKNRWRRKHWFASGLHANPVLTVLFVGYCLLDLVSSLHDFVTLAIPFSVSLLQPNE